MVLEDRFSKVVQVISNHNSVIGAGNPGYIDCDKLIANIKIAGGTSEDRLKRFSYEDILQCMPPTTDGKIYPTVLAKDIAAIFRDSDEKEKSGRPVSSRQADRMTPEELVRAFDPEESTNAIGKRLQWISRGEAFIVFSDGRNVDVETTTKLLLEVKQGFTGRCDINVNGNPKKVYKIGELPDSYADANPLYPNRLLRPDGTCDQTGRSWSGISIEVRQLIYLAVKSDELQLNIETAHSIIDIALKSDAMNVLRQRYRNASLEFDRLQKINDLPKLILPMRSRHESSSLKDGRKVIMERR